jgi:hypothetical protein
LTQQIDYGIPGAKNWINAGWVVAATDYQGLGTPGIHQYSVNRTNAIDAVTIVGLEHPTGMGAALAGSVYRRGAQLPWSI